LHPPRPARCPHDPPREGEPMSTTVIPVTTPTGGYDVHVGRGLLADLPTLVPERVRRIVIVHQPSLRDVAEQVRAAIAETGRQAFAAEVPAGEGAKSAQVAGFLWGVCGQAEIGREDLVIGLGGGATTDLAGFVAASWLRGVDVLQVPTTAASTIAATVVVD